MLINNCVLRTGDIEIWHNKSDEGPGLDFCSHSHAEYEILYVFCGNVEFYVEGYKYSLLPGSMLLTPPNNFHGWKPCSCHLYHRVSILFMAEALNQAEQDLFLNMFSGGSLFFPDTSSRDIPSFIHALLGCGDMKEDPQKIALKSRLVSLLSEIPFLRANHAAEPAVMDTRISKVLTYLEENLQKKLCLEDLGRRFNISKNYLNTLFRKATGTTVNHYVRIKRLGLARQEIRQGTHAEEAAYRAGFTDYSNFYRAYRAFYGSVPSASAAAPL